MLSSDIIAISVCISIFYGTHMMTKLPDDSWAPMAYACNPNYLGDLDQEDQVLGQPGK
jgi:hypothetical protein